MRSPSLLPPLASLGLALLLAAPGWSQEPRPETPPPADPPGKAEREEQPAAASRGKAVERYYDDLKSGQKRGYYKVTWAPSTWQGQKTLRDTTIVISKSRRASLGRATDFSSTVKIQLERDLDGSLFWQRTEVQEGSRTLVDELTWTGKGYRYVSRKVGGQETQTIEVACGAPTHCDAESFLSEKIRQGQLKEGQILTMRALDLRGRRVREIPLTIGGLEQIEGHEGPVNCRKATETDPDTGAKTILWIDDQGAFVQLKGEGGRLTKRVTREKAEQMPVKPMTFSIVTAAEPSTERLFTADECLLDLHLQGDPDRPLPEIPSSPWSEVGSVSGNDEAGWLLKLRLKSYDEPGAQATFADVDRKKFKDDLAPTVILCSDHPQVLATAKQVVGDAKTLREGARRLARYVFTSLRKQSPDVGQTTAAEILASGIGDCSEHCALFVALCRAAGIPARRCSGYVCLGSQWGNHAWAEIWTGAWIGADPTTGEIGAGARYLFYGYQDRPDSYPGLVSSRLAERMRLVFTRIAEDGQACDLTDSSQHRIHEPAQGRYVHNLAGLTLEGIPPEWTVTLYGAGGISMSCDGLSVSISAHADQGADLDSYGPDGRFAGKPARTMRWGQREIHYLHHDRQMIQVSVSGADEAPRRRAELEGLLAQLFGGPKPTPAPGKLTAVEALRSLAMRDGQLDPNQAAQVLFHYWQQVAHGERLAAAGAAVQRLVRLQAEGNPDPDLRVAVARTRRKLATEALQIDRERPRIRAALSGKLASEAVVPASGLPDALELERHLVTTSAASVQACQARWAQQPTASAAEELLDEELAAIRARLVARVAHDRLLAQEGRLAAHYGLVAAPESLQPEQPAPSDDGDADEGGE